MPASAGSASSVPIWIGRTKSTRRHRGHHRPGPAGGRRSPPPARRRRRASRGGWSFWRASCLRRWWRRSRVPLTRLGAELAASPWAAVRHVPHRARPRARLRTVVEIPAPPAARAAMETLAIIAYEQPVNARRDRGDAAWWLVEEHARRVAGGGAHRPGRAQGDARAANVLRNHAGVSLRGSACAVRTAQWEDLLVSCRGIGWWRRDAADARSQTFGLS